jgi:P-type Ca2+ transporter type 2C
MPEWYGLSPDEALERAQSSIEGLPETEAARRLDEHGPNELTEAGVKSPWRILAEQFTSLLIIILVIAAVVSAALGDLEDAIAILAIVILNGALGFRQEYKAEKTMSALRKLAAPIVRVRRGGDVREAPAAELVPGDIVLIEAGNVVPADARLLESASLRVQEAALTGESEPVEKTVATLTAPDVGLADRVNMLFMGTAASYGRGEAVVTATGMDTELGKIAGMVQQVKTSRTPLQKRLGQLGRWLAVAALALVIVIFVVGLVRGEPVRVMFLTAVSMAVAAVPEGLPAIVTVALSLGAQRMLRRNALIRKLPAVETLGSVTVICSDKTGTLTENRMTVVILDVAGHEVDLQEEMERGSMAPLPCATTGDQAPLLTDKPAVALLVAAGTLCNDSVLQTTDTARTCMAPGESRYSALGDPTESAIVIAGVHLGLLKTSLSAEFPRLGEIPFDSERKLMTTVHAVPTGPVAGLEALSAHLVEESATRVVFTKGAPESLLPLAVAHWDGQQALLLDESTRKAVEARNQALAAGGMRVLAVGFRALADGADAAASSSGDTAGWESGLVLAGLIAMIDPARAEAREAVLTAAAAGIRPVMITGDQPLTAGAIAQQVGILSESSVAIGALSAGDGAPDPLPVLTGAQLSLLDPAQLAEEVDRIAVYARVAPEQKLIIVEALQRRGHVVAMTGDGVNDAPALQKADIGIAMGITGTDVAKAAADMVLLDDNFATIVAAVREGRAIYDNIRKFIKYLMATNVGELTVMLFAPLAGMPLPLLPLQILWMNLVTDGLPGLALGFEPAEPDVMQRRPNPPNESIFARGLGTHILWAGPLMGVIALLTGWVYWRAGDDAWQTMLFTVMTVSQMFHVLAIHQESRSVFGRGFITNPLLLGAVALTILLQFALVYIPALQGVFGTQALNLEHILIAFALSTLILWVIEAQKFVSWIRERSRHTQRADAG